MRMANIPKLIAPIALIGAPPYPPQRSGIHQLALYPVMSIATVAGYPTSRYRLGLLPMVAGGVTTG